MAAEIEILPSNSGYLVCRAQRVIASCAYEADAETLRAALVARDAPGAEVVRQPLPARRSRQTPLEAAEGIDVSNPAGVARRERPAYTDTEEMQLIEIMGGGDPDRDLRLWAINRGYVYLDVRRHAERLMRAGSIE